MFEFVKPEATTNLCTNPSMAFGTTNWQSKNATISKSYEQARFGRTSLKVVTQGLAIYEGTSYPIKIIGDAIVSANPDYVGMYHKRAHTISVYLRGYANSTNVRIRIYDGAADKTTLSDTIALDKNRWIRASLQIVPGQTTSTSNLSIYVETTTKTQATFYVDGLQIEQKPYLTTYCDGDQEGCYWKSTPHGSISYRLADSYAGGRPCPLDKIHSDLAIIETSGLFQTPVSNVVEKTAANLGVMFQSTRYPERSISLTFVIARNQKGYLLSANDRDMNFKRLRAAQKKLADFISPNGKEEPFTLCYTVQDRTFSIRCRYADGLQGDKIDERQDGYWQFVVKLTAFYPLWVEDDKSAQLLTYIDSPGTIVGPSGIVRRPSGTWSAISGNVAFVMNSLCVTRDGYMLLRGSSSIDKYVPAGFGDSNDTLTTWATVAGTVIPIVNAVVEAPNGDIYAGGSFTTISSTSGATLASNVARYSWATNLWYAIDTGVNGEVHDMKLSEDGKYIHVCGAFTQVDGNNSNFIASIDLTTIKWRRYGNGLNYQAAYTSEAAYHLITFKDGTFWVSGYFYYPTKVLGSVRDNYRNYRYLASWDEDIQDFINPIYPIFIDKTPISDANVTYAVVGIYSLIYKIPNTEDVIIALSSQDDAACAFFDANDDIVANMIGIWDGHTIYNPDPPATTDLSSRNFHLDRVTDMLYDTVRRLVYMGTMFAPYPHPVGAYNMDSIRGYIGNLENARTYIAWNGSSFVHPDIYAITGSSSFRLGGLSLSNNLYMQSGAYTRYAYNNTVTNNNSFVAYPVLYVEGPGVLKTVSNYTTGKHLYFDLKLAVGEVATIDFRPQQQKMYTTSRSNVWDGLIPTSDFSSFNLVPGENKISVLFDDTTSVSMVQLTWEASHASLSAISD